MSIEDAKYIENLKKDNERLRGALRVIDSVVPSRIPGNSDAYVKEICRKYLDEQTTQPSSDSKNQ